MDKLSGFGNHGKIGLLPHFEKLDGLQRLAAENIEGMLTIAEDYGVISETHVHGETLDFGCGSGGSSWYLANIGSKVTALDLGDMEKLRKLKVLDESRIKSGNGFKYIGEMPDDYLDMVCSVMFGPDLNGDLGKIFFLLQIQN